MSTAPSLNPLIAEGQCGDTRVIGRFEWVCIADPHATTPPPPVRYTDRPIIPSENHHYVNRYGEGVERPLDSP